MKGGTKTLDPMHNVWYTKLKEDTGDRYDFYKTYLFFALIIVASLYAKEKWEMCMELCYVDVQLTE